MNVCLICPPFYFRQHIYYLSQNLGIGYVAGVLAKAGHKVTVIDALAEGFEKKLEVEHKYETVFRYGLNYNEIVDRIPGNTQLIGITAPFTNHALIIKGLSSDIKSKYKNVPIAIGGIYPSVLKEKALTDHIDYLVTGEGEEAMLRLANGDDPRMIKGLIFKESGELVNTGQAEIVKDLDSLPFPARHLMPMEKYFLKNPRQRPGKRSVSMITSRGCPFKCNYCAVHSIYGHRWRRRSAKNVMHEIRELVSTYGVNHIDFEDDNITLHKHRAIELFQEIKRFNKESNIRLTWAASNGIRIDTLDRDVLEAIRDSGCVTLALAVESGDKEVLNSMNKRLDLEKVKEIAKICDELGIMTYGFLIVGYPGETRKRFLNSIEFCKFLQKNGMGHFEVFITKAMPGTNLSKLCVENNYLINPDLENALILDEYINIETEDFDSNEVMWRFKYANRALNPIRYYTDKLGIVKKAILKIIAPQQFYFIKKYIYKMIRA